MTEPTLYLDGRVTLLAGDCLEILATMPENSVDAVVTDPPYHLNSIVERFGTEGAAEAATGVYKRSSAGFMGKKWDGGDVAFQIDTWRAVLRVLKPGGYIFAFASSRGFGRMSVAIEDAGFTNHPFFAWIFGSGFPKATRVKAPGYEGQRYGGQAMKPAMEPIYMGQKPFAEDTGTANILRWGTGAVNIDACRVVTEENLSGGAYSDNGARKVSQSLGPTGMNRAGATVGKPYEQPKGRWPANVIHDGSEEVLAGFPDLGVSSGGRIGNAGGGTVQNLPVGAFEAGDPGYGDTGSAARFFYSAKADSSDRIGSRHPTVKPVDLMQYLVRLITPKDGVVLDPFAGTGTTGEAAFREGFRSILIEREPEYQHDIAERMRLVKSGPDEKRREITKRRGETAAAGPLFGDEDG